MTTAKALPSRGWYLVAVLVFLGGAVGGTGFFLWFLFTSIGGGQQFLIPGTTTLEAAKPGTYVLWYDHATLLNGRAYQFDERLPNGLRVRITESASNQEVPLNQGFGGSETLGNLRRVTVGEFEVRRPGPYVIEVTGPFEARVFSVRRSLTARFFLSIVALILVDLMGWFGAIAIIVRVFLVRRRAGASW
ncbi:MAG TPA: hypothetical protein VKW04_08925 [Planctomycetota bacterium]|nr:hypothetical protein [Planctomycetota bacterium]